MFQELREVESVRDLGIFLDRKLTFKLHTSKLIKQAKNEGRVHYQKFEKLKTNSNHTGSLLCPGTFDNGIWSASMVSYVINTN